MLKIKVFYILLLEWLIAIFSIFAPVPIYPVFFLIFIYTVFLYFIKVQRIHTNTKSKLLIFCCILHIFWGMLVFFIKFENSDPKTFIKLSTNYLFLVTSLIFISSYLDKLLLNIKFIGKLFEIIIFFSCIQIILNIILTNAFLLPIKGISSSSEAYILVSQPVYFGIPDKNIWATKIMFIQISYLALIYFKLFSISKIKSLFLFSMIFFNSFYSFSRTAALAFFIFIIFMLLIQVVNRRGMYRKIFYLGITTIITVGCFLMIFQKILHLDLNANLTIASKSDGLFSRIMLWLAYYNNLNDLNPFLGNGILFGKQFIPSYTIFTNDNLHNVFLNVLLDEGIVGLVLYCFLLFLIFTNVRLKCKYLLILFFPLFVVINSHYIGFDNDLVIYYSICILIFRLTSRTGREFFTNKYKISLLQKQQMFN